ncbi:hypothetical protein [Rhizobium sp. BR 314]
MAGTPDGEEGVLAGAVDALFDGARLPSHLEQAIAASIGRQAVFDLMATVGFYSVLGFILMTFDTPIDQDVVDEMAEHPI